MNLLLLTLRVPLGRRGMVHPLRRGPPAASRQIHAPRDPEPVGIGCQLMAAEPACHKVTFRIPLSAPSEPPFKNIAAILQSSKQGIRFFPIGNTLDPSR